MPPALPTLKSESSCSADGEKSEEESKGEPDSQEIGQAEAKQEPVAPADTPTFEARVVETPQSEDSSGEGE